MDHDGYHRQFGDMVDLGTSYKPLADTSGNWQILAAANHTQHVTMIAPTGTLSQRLQTTTQPPRTGECLQVISAAPPNAFVASPTKSAVTS